MAFRAVGGVNLIELLCAHCSYLPSLADMLCRHWPRQNMKAAKSMSDNARQLMLVRDHVPSDNNNLLLKINPKAAFSKAPDQGENERSTRHYGQVTPAC